MISETIKIDTHDTDRYDRLKRYTWFDLQKVSQTNVLVVGVGALGNEVCKNLVLSGFKRITLVDMDDIVRSNLNRCVFFNEKDVEKKKATIIKKELKKLEVDIDVKAYVSRIQDLSEDFISTFDIVLGCLDNISTRLHVNAHCYHYKIPYIDGGTQGLIGKVQIVRPPNTSCLECAMNKTHKKIRDMRLSCTGEQTTFYEPKYAADINTTSIISAVQVQEALKIVHKRYDAVIKDLFYYDGNRNVFEVLEVPINPNCNHTML